MTGSVAKKVALGSGMTVLSIAVLLALVIAVHAGPGYPCVVPERQKLTPSGVPVGASVGWSVAADRSKLVVGAPFDQGGCPGDPQCQSGAAYVFRWDSNRTPLDSSDDFFVEEAKLTASDAGGADDFGTSVSISGDRVVVGAHFKDGAGDYSGAAYVFRHDDRGTPTDPSDDRWIQETKLVPADAAEWDLFGGSVSINGKRIVVAASSDDDACPSNPDCNSGAVYVFRLDDRGTPSDPRDDLWVPTGKITPADAAMRDYFGASVSVSDARVAVGALKSEVGYRSGVAYIFRIDDGNTPLDPTDDRWVQEAKLTASDPAAVDLLGCSVSISGDAVVVGASGDDDAGAESGAAYVFRRDDRGTPSDPTDDRWDQEAKLTASDGSATARFGTAVGMSGDRIIVGAFMDDGACPSDPGCDSGTAYLFRRVRSGWVQEFKLVASDAAAHDGLGKSVAINGDTASAGAHADDDHGSVYVFRAPSGGTDLRAYSKLQSCFGSINGSLPSECREVNFDGDADVDLGDFATFSCFLHGP